MPRLPPMRAVQAFEAVARGGSVAVAAGELGVTPGAVSQQIHNIEKALGTQLFERRGRTLELTTWGRLYYDRVHNAFDQLRAAQEALRRARSKSGIVFSALPSLALRWLRPLLLGWRATHSGAAIHLISTDEEAVLADEQIDFRLSYGADGCHYDHFVELFIDTIVPVCSPSFLAQHPVRTLGDILQGPLFDIEWDVSHRRPPSWADWARSVRLPPPPGSDLAFSLSSAGIDAAVNGGGFVLGQMAMIADDLANGRLVIPIDCRLSMPEPYVLAWDPAALDRPFGKEFRAFVIAAARRQAVLSKACEPFKVASKTNARKRS
jgi:LysR family glycine cleavage system transcriptional activator